MTDIDPVVGFSAAFVSVGQIGAAQMIAAGNRRDDWKDMIRLYVRALVLVLQYSNILLYYFFTFNSSFIRSVGEIFTLPLVVLVSFLAQPRLMYAMSVDGLLPKVNTEIAFWDFNRIIIHELSVCFSRTPWIFFLIYLMCCNLGFRWNRFSRQFDEKHYHQWCPVHIDINFCRFWLP